MAELGVVAERAFDGRLRDVARTELGGLPYVTFTLVSGGAVSERAVSESAGEADATDVALLSALASPYALFEVVESADGTTGTADSAGTASPAGSAGTLGTVPAAARDLLLRPVPRAAVDLLDPDLLTIQRYAGKTNEDFTRLLLDVTVAATDRPRDLAGPWTTRPDGRPRRLRVLDPMAGRGTTLNQALIRGWDAAGIDVDAKDVEAYALFLRTWLKNHRLKHSAELTTLRRDGKSLGRRFAATVGLTPEQYRAGDTVSVELVNADTVRAAELFPAGHFDVLVTDAPYGVQHGNRASGTRGRDGRSTARDELTRSPVPLLRKALPGWVRLLRRGGAVGISWNTHVARRPELVAVLEEAGLEVLGEHTGPEALGEHLGPEALGEHADGGAAANPWRGFGHRVDQAIHRDLVVARKPR